MNKLSSFHAWSLIGLTALVLAYMMLFMRGGFAEWRPEYANSSPEVQAWFKAQRLTDETRARLNVNYKACCDHTDAIRGLKYRVVDDGTKYGAETYEYLKDGKWKRLHPDLVQRKPTPDGKPVLFVSQYTGQELCLIIDEGGI